MTNKFELYKFKIFGNVIEILVSGDGHPVCCGEEMERMEAKNDNQNSVGLTEKHSPIIEYDSDGNVNVAIYNHPMEDAHYIMFVQTISKDKNEAKIKYFYPNEKVQMSTDINGDGISARSYCNIHGVYLNQ